MQKPEMNTRPWIRAESETRFALYWAGVSSFPWREEEKRWFIRFLLHFTQSLQATGLLPCFFLETRTVHRHCHRKLLREAADYRTMMVLSRTPWEPVMDEFSAEEADALRRQEKPFELDNYLGGQAHWFRNFSAETVFPGYFGFGGATMLFVPPDPATAPPAVDFPPGIRNSPMLREAFARGNPVQELRYLLLLKHRALASLKQAFSRGAEDSQLVQTVPVLIPRLRSRDFFSLEQQVLDVLFEASPIYLAESPEDRGILIASAKPLDEMLAGLVATVNGELAEEKAQEKKEENLQ